MPVTLSRDRCQLLMGKSPKAAPGNSLATFGDRTIRSTKSLLKLDT
ncbi:hypothetical protein [Nostoc sp.]